MGCWDCFCVICGCPYRDASGFFNDADLELSDRKLEELEEKYSKASQWMNDCIFLKADGEIVPDVKEDMCMIYFKDKNGEIYSVKNDEYDEDEYGVFIHTDCYKYLEKKTGIRLNYMHLPEKNIEIGLNYLNNINYGVEKYFGQDFNFTEAYEDKKDFVMYSPLSKDNNAEKNRSRINKVISQLKLKKDRKGPLVSATFYEEGDYKFGMDKQIWVKKNDKWAKTDFMKKIIEVKYDLDIADNFRRVGESDTRPIFIKVIGKKKIKRL